MKQIALKQVLLHNDIGKNYCKLDNPDTHVYTLVELYDIQLRDVCLRYQYKYDQQAEQVSCRILDGCHKSLNTNTPKFAHRFFISALANRCFELMQVVGYSSA